MMNESISDLAAFCAIVEQGSFRAAAKQLRVTPSALSHRIKNLEDCLQVRLLNRTTRSVAPTDAGRALYDRVSPAMREMSGALQSLDDYRSGPTGTLRLNVPANAARVVLAPAIAGFCRDNPNVRLEIIENDGFVDIVAGGFDAGIRFEETLAPGMTAIRLGPSIRPMVIASPDYLKRYGTPKTPNDLANHNCINLLFPGGELAPWDFTDGENHFVLANNGNLTVSSTQMMLDAVRNGIGIGQKLQGIADEAIEHGEIVPILEDWMPDYGPFWIYYPKRTYLPSALRAFINSVRAFHGQTGT